MSIHTTKICMGTYSLSVFSILVETPGTCKYLHLCFMFCFLIFQEKQNLKWKFMDYNYR